MLSTIEKMGVAQPSLRAIAEALGTPQQRIYSVSKQPKMGEVYDPKVYNWDAITKFVEKRLSDELPTFEAVINKALEIDAELAQRDGRRGTRGSSKELIQVGDKFVPARKYNFEIGDEVALKNDGNVYKVVYQTPVSMVLQPIAPVESEALTCLSNWTLNQKILGASQLAEGIEARKKGEWVDPKLAKAQAAADADEATEA